MRKLLIWTLSISMVVAFSLFSYEAVAKEQIVLRIADWQAGVDNILNSYREFIRIFEERHPGVKIEYTQYSYTTYEEFLKPALAAGTAPDIFAIFPGVPLVAIAESGNVVPISDVIDDEWKSWLGKAYYFSGLNYKGKLWAAPQDAQTVGIWFYIDMLETLGVEVPPLGGAFTVDELIKLAEPARQHGWDLIAAGFLDYYSATDPYYNMVHQLQESDTPDMVLQAYNGEISWQQDIFRVPMEAFKKMHEAGVWREDAINMDYQVQAWGKWLNREAIGIWENGDWFAGSVPREYNNPDNPDIRILSFPLVHKGVPPTYNWGFGTDLAIYSRGKHQDLAKEFIRFTNSPEAAKIFVKNYVNPAAGLDPQALLEIKTDNPVFNDCLKMYYSIKGRFSEYWYKNPEGVDALFTGIVDVMIGQRTIDEVLAHLDKVCGYKG